MKKLFLGLMFLAACNGPAKDQLQWFAKCFLPGGLKGPEMIYSGPIRSDWQYSQGALWFYDLSSTRYVRTNAQCLVYNGVPADEIMQQDKEEQQ